MSSTALTAGQLRQALTMLAAPPKNPEDVTMIIPHDGCNLGECLACSLLEES